MAFKTIAWSMTLASLTVAEYSVKPCHAGDCASCNDEIYHVTAGVPRVNAYNSFDAKGFEPVNGSTGYNVWWDVSPPDEDCAILIYQAFSQASSASGWGNVILETRAGGCFFAHMSGNMWATQFCCGSGDCGQVQPGDVVYTASEPAAPEPSVSVPAVSTAISFAPLISTSEGLVPTSTISGTAPTTRSATPYSTIHQRRQANPEPVCGDAKLTKLYECVSGTWSPAPPSCARSSTSEVFQKSGPQLQLSSLISCNLGTGCQQTHSGSITVTETLTNTNSVQTTTSNGVSVSISAGFSLGAESGPNFEVGGSVDYTHEWSKAITDSTEYSNATATAVTDSYGFTIPIGVAGFTSFTPTYQCKNQTVTCDGVPLELEHCTPLQTGDKMAQGEYMWVTVGGA